MKAMLSAALVLGFSCAAGAADDKKDEKKAANAVGKWQCEYSIGDQKRTSELTITKDGDKFAGTMTWRDQKNEKLKDVKFKDATLSFSAVRKFMGNEIPIDYSLKIDGDSLKGTGSSDFGGQKNEFEIKGKRAKKDEKKGEKKDKKDK